MNPRCRRRGRTLATLAHAEAGPFYGERILQDDAGAWRAWRPDRSKLAAYLLRTAPPFELHEDATVLYLGAARGGTVSHVSDLVPDGHVVAVEPSPVELVGLLRLARARDNVHPVAADARHASLLQTLVHEPHLLYQDVAQREQVRIFLDAARTTRARHGLLALKARSVRVQARPEDLYDQAADDMRAQGHAVHHVTTMQPEQKDHAMLAVTFNHRDGP